MGIVTTTLLSAVVTAAPAWSVQWSPRVDSARPVLGQTHRPTRQTTEVARHFDAESQADFLHEFRDLDLPDVDGEQADTNSYVHRLTFAWQHSSETRRLRLGITLAVSSNALKSAGDLGAEDLRPAVGVAWRAGPAWLALHADDRLGRTLVYPGFELPLRPAPSQEIRLGFPESSWHWQIAPRWRSVAAIEPDGACWRVRDEQLERRSEVCSQSWQAAWTLRWQATNFLAVDAAVGHNFKSTLEYQLRDGSTVRVDVPAGSFYGFSIGARF
jgi:hypothetical protein